MRGEMASTTSSGSSASSSDVSYAYQPPSRRPLPLDRNLDGRPVWEPPILDYSDLIEEEYEQKRKAVLKYYRNDVVRATAFIDTDTETHLLEMYSRSVWEEMERPKAGVDIDIREFFYHLWDEIMRDMSEIMQGKGWEELMLEKRDNGTYKLLKYDGCRAWHEVSDYLQDIEQHRNDDDGDDEDDERSPETSSAGTQEAISEAEDEDGAETLSNDIPTTAAETTNQSDEHILDALSAVEELELAFLSTPTSTTPQNPAPNMPPRSSIDDRQDADETATQMDLLTLWW